MRQLVFLLMMFIFTNIILISRNIRGSDIVNVIIMSDLHNEQFDIMFQDTEVIDDLNKIRLRDITFPSKESSCVEERVAANTLHNLLKYLMPPGTRVRLVNYNTDIPNNADIILSDGADVKELLLKTGLVIPSNQQKPWCIK